MHYKRNYKICIGNGMKNRISIFIFLLLSFSFSSFPLFSQQSKVSKITVSTISVKGNIKDINNEPIVGAIIKIENSQKGVMSDIDGNFSIDASANSNLLISFLGFASQRIQATTSPISIVLLEDAAKLEDVVVVGYGKVKRENLTGSVSSLAMKEVTDFAAPNLATVLSGKMPGVHISEATGNPLGVSTINIRINGTFSATDEPLYVIDGFIRDVTAFNRLDPSEIESISVLKDAAASIYGVRGANGVVLVNSKKGIAGKPKVTYSGSYGVTQGIKMPEMMSAYEQGVALNDLWNQEIKYKNSDPTKYNFFTDPELNKLKSLDYNWLEMGWKDSDNTRHTLNVSGGSETVRYFVAGSYMNANGNFSNLNSNRFGIRFGVDVDIVKNLKGNFVMDYNQKKTNAPLNSIDTEYDRMYGTFSELARTPRFIPAYINGLPVNYDVASSGVHPLEMFNSGSYRLSNSNDVVASLDLQYSVPGVKGLNLSVSGNYSKTTSFGKQVSKPYFLYGFEKDVEFTHLLTDRQLPITDDNYMRTVTNGDKIQESASFGYTYQINPQISYSNIFGKHNVSGFLMYEQSESGGNGLSEGRQTVIIPNYEVMAGYSTASQVTASNINTLTRRQSFIGRLNYIYADKYILESAARYEASTNFAPGYRWGLFPSVSLGWRISEEDFFKENVKFMNNLKLRASAGRLGNDKTASNQWRNSYVTNGTSLIGGGVAVTNLKPSNGGLVYTIASWESTNSYDVGLDMGFLNDLSVSLDGFYKHTFDILDTPQSIFPQSSGITGQIPKLNYGILNAWGGEAEIEYNKRLNRDFSFQIRGNFAYAMNKVIKKYQNPGVIGTWKDENGKVSGGEVGFFSNGIARTQDDLDAYIEYLTNNYNTYHGSTGNVSVFGVSEADLKPGMLMFKDVGSASYQDENGKWHDGAPDGIIDDNDQRIISKYSFNPYNYGFSLGFKWKDLSFDAMFTGSFGSNVVFEKGFWTDASGGGRTGSFLSLYSNQLKEWYGNYWTENNINAKYPRLDSYSFRGNRSTFWMRNGHELSFKTINISYNLPSAYIKSVGIEQCRVYVQGSNLWTIINPYPYKDASVGFWSDYPMIRTINIGLNLTF